MDRYGHPFLRDDSQDVVDTLTDAAFAVLRDGGSAGLSIRAIADRLNVTPPALTIRWRTEREGARARILRLVALTFGDRWRAWSTSPLFGRHPSLALPVSDDEHDGVRAWLAFRELARSDMAGGNPDIAGSSPRRWS